MTKTSLCVYSRFGNAGAKTHSSHEKRRFSKGVILPKVYVRQMENKLTLSQSDHDRAFGHQKTPVFVIWQSETSRTLCVRFQLRVSCVVRR